ncbi:uncharacterized protein [Aegilops tauschii subsp. strangulata]|uniref:Uncharacterized protein n=1 Tax=Aegilops tauschii subsp. strangulata TaxID=200361 RepID=A0A453C787_AEGTS|nr:uncharacterized protein LOC109771222 isoform X6 [Aegilops tauschii subsp. strangulata]
MPAKIFQILSTQPPSLQEDFNEWSPRSCPKSYKRLRLDEPLTKTHLYSEFLHAKMDHQLRNMLANLSQMMATDMDTCIHMGCFLRQCRPLIQLMMLKFSMALAPHTYGMFPPSMAQCCPLIQLMMLKFLMALACKAIQMWKIDLLVAMRELYMKKLYRTFMQHISQETKEEDLSQAGFNRWSSAAKGRERQSHHWKFTV